MKYNLEVDRIVAEAKKIKAKSIILHLPDGLKPKALELVRELEKKTGATVSVWAASNFGACDMPKLPDDYDLLVTFGHSSPYANLLPNK